MGKKNYFVLEGHIMGVLLDINNINIELVYLKIEKRKTNKKPTTNIILACVSNGDVINSQEHLRKDFCYD